MKSKQARIIKTLIQAVLVVTIGYVIRHKIAETHAPMWIAAGWLLSAWMVLRVVLAARRGYANFRAHTQSGVNLDNIDKLTTATMHPWMRGYYAMEKRAYRGAWRTLALKHLAPVGDFSVSGGPRGKMLAAGALLLVVACGVLGALAVPGLTSAFWPRVFWYAGVIGTAMYAAIWVLGVRRNLQEGGHRITHDELILDMGIRGSGAVALKSIASGNLLDQSIGPIASSDVWTLSPGEPVNVLVELTRSTELAITAFGSPREISKRFIALYVDHPERFVTALSAACAGSGRHAA